MQVKGNYFPVKAKTAKPMWSSLNAINLVHQSSLDNTVVSIIKSSFGIQYSLLGWSSN